MYFQVWILSVGFCWSIIGLILVEHAKGQNLREMKKKSSMLTHDERISSANGGYNDNYQYNNGYDYVGSSGTVGSRDTNYDNYGLSHSSRNNYDGYGNTRKSGDFRHFGNSNSNMHRDFDGQYSTRSARKFKNRNDVNAFKKFQ